MSKTTFNVSPFRILCDITFHYNEARLQYLFQVLKSLSEYPVESMDIVIFTNVTDEEKIHKIMSLCSPLFERHPSRQSGDRALMIESHPGLVDPWHLPWCHKQLISDRFFGPGNSFTHYIHIEDDILLSFANFCYFIQYLELLRPMRLIPSFQRVEFNSIDNKLYLLDQIGVSDFASRKKINLDNFAFVNPDYPHIAMFILDNELAMEYVKSRSFDRERSMEVRPIWGLCERASMGLCFESPPEGFSSRYVIPVAPDTLIMPYWSWVYHLTNNYVNNPMTRHGKTPVDQLFQSTGSAAKWSPPSILYKGLWHFKRLLKRLTHGSGHGTGHGSVPQGLCPLCCAPPPKSGRCPKAGCPNL